MFEWLYKTPERTAEDNYPDEQESYADFVVRRPDLALKHGLIPLQQTVEVELQSPMHADPDC